MNLYITGLFVLGVSVIQAIVSTFFSVGLALLLVRYLYCIPTFMSRWWLALVPFFCVVSSKIIAIALHQSFQVTGMVAILMTHVFWNMPLAFYLLHTRYQKFDHQMRHAASDLGADEYEVLCRVEWPFMRSTLLSVSLIIFLLCFASFSVPRLFGDQWYHFTLAQSLFVAYQKSNISQMFFYYGLRLLVVLPLLRFKNRYKRQAVSVDRPVYGSFTTKNLWGRVYGIGLIGLFIIALSTLFFSAFSSKNIIFLHSVITGSYDHVLGLSVLQAIYNSLFFALVSSSILIVVLFFLTFFVRREPRWFVALLVVPFLLGGVGCGIVFKTVLYQSVVSIIASHCFLNYPVAYYIIYGARSLYAHQFDLQVQSYGASVWQRMIMFASFARNALKKAFCLVFSLSIAEAGAASLVANGKGMTIPLAIRLYYKRGMIDQAVCISAFFLIIVFVLSFFLAQDKKVGLNV